MKDLPVVLLADDDDAVRRVLQRMLERQGWRVLAAATAAQALHLGISHTGPVDLLVTDVILPDRSGVQLAYDLAEHRAGLPILFVSGHPHEDATRFGVTGPGYHFLQKPIDINEFSDVVRRLAGGGGRAGTGPS